MVTCVNSNKQPWNSTLPTLTLFPNCKTQCDINQIHARLLTTGLIKNPYLTTKLVLNFSPSPYKPLVQFSRYIFFSHSVFQNPKTDDPFLWNAVIKSYSHGSFDNNDPKEAVFVLGLMIENGVCVDKFTISLVLKACSRMGLVKEGMQVHGLMKKIGLGCDLYLQNCLICFYVRCGWIEIARQVFDRMVERDSVSFNSMIDGYVKYGMVALARRLFDSMPLEVKNLRSWNCMISGYGVVEDGFRMACELFDKMPERDLVSWNLMIGCCIESGKIALAHALFDRMPEKDVISWAKLIDGYAKSGSVEIARGLFDEMPKKDVISWNLMMARYVQSGECLDAIELYHNEMSAGNISPDETTLSIVLSAIAQLGRIDDGISVHFYIEENGFKLDGKLGVSLIDMYGKSGSIENAIRVFEGIEEKTVDHWNAMIGGFAIHGFGKLAFDMFFEMERLHIKPDGITFINVLNACSHSGMIKEGLICFEIMRRLHKVEADIQHYGCIIDMLARAGKIKEATRIIEEMPIEPNDVLWRTLLSACSNNEDLNRGEPIAKYGSRMGFCDSGSYVLLSNIYARFGMWDRVRRIRSMMTERELKKVPGRSWIELDGIFHEFFVGDGSHSEVKEIYSLLDNRFGSKSKAKSISLEYKPEPALF